MQADIRFFYEASLDTIANEGRLVEVVRRIFSDYMAPIHWLNVILIPTKEHTKMNADFLDHHYETDILTFPVDGEDGPAGEIYINEDIARKNAKEYDNSFEEELARLIIHGALHLVGLNDQTSEEQEGMTAQEDKYLLLI